MPELGSQVIMIGTQATAEYSGIVETAEMLRQVVDCPDYMTFVKTYEILYHIVR